MLKINKSSLLLTGIIIGFTSHVSHLHAGDNKTPVMNLKGQQHGLGDVKKTAPASESASKTTAVDFKAPLSCPMTFFDAVGWPDGFMAVKKDWGLRSRDFARPPRLMPNSDKIVNGHLECVYSDKPGVFYTLIKACDVDPNKKLEHKVTNSMNKDEIEVAVCKSSGAGSHKYLCEPCTGSAWPLSAK